jgi:hypothetical protein
MLAGLWAAELKPAFKKRTHEEKVLWLYINRYTFLFLEKVGASGSTCQEEALDLGTLVCLKLLVIMSY